MSRKADQSSHCQLPIADCQLTEQSGDDLIGGRQSTDDQRRAAIWRALETVVDPEIPVLSVVDLGIIADVRVGEGGVGVDVTPTFAGCPALSMIREQIRSAIEALGESTVVVNLVYDPPWTSERLSEAGRAKLKEIGLSPPMRVATLDRVEANRTLCGNFGGFPPADLDLIPCPYCDSLRTELESLFGPTLCRSIHYCHACRQSFEHFKNV